MIGSDSALVDIHNPNGSLPPLVMVVSWANDRPRAEALAQVLGDDQPVIALLPPPLVDGQLPRRMEGWVDHARTALDSVDLEGPVQLFGYSFGGVVALELARSLVDDGRDVGWLGIIDTMRPLLNPQGFGPYVRYHLHEALAIRDTALRRAYIKKRATSGWNRTYAKLGRRVRPFLMAIGLRDAPVELHPLETGDGIQPEPRAIILSYLTYEASPIDLPVSLFTTANTVERAGGDPSLKWSRYLRGGFTVTPVSGPHLGVFEPEHIHSIAGAICGELARAKDRAATGSPPGG